MLKVLNETISRLPLIFNRNTLDDWKSLLIDYEPPTVERVYMDLEDGIRLSLHVIQPCDKDQAFFHPHDWPSAIYILSGVYEMKVGYSSGLTAPPVATTIMLNSGSSYEMVDPDGWHSVRPIGFESRSIMVNGPSWNRPMPKVPQRKLNPLSDERKLAILNTFKKDLVRLF